MTRQFTDSPAARSFCESKRCPVSPSYWVDENGRVGRIGRTEPLKPCKLKRGGYLAVALWESNKGKTWAVHVLVALTFHGPKPSPKHNAAHHDGNRENNAASNIMWKTKTENEADKVRHGTTNRGERNGMAKLTNAQTDEIKRRLAAGERNCHIARDFPQVTKGAIGLIKARMKRGSI